LAPTGGELWPRSREAEPVHAVTRCGGGKVPYRAQGERVRDVLV
jgi:hypothetical protein